ncbi:MAG: 3-oxo-tetronate kinase [Actinomycetaceae bacterium]|nr:four-carbon acid sugar kinase family protein [Actinomycetaceae bacterium]MDY6082243.1 3-oxo-tetronate kinase [Actinomycetaceae bacterium]
MWGCIADDFTGATDVAISFRLAGFRTAVILQPDLVHHEDIDMLDAIVIALKSRTTPAAQAVQDSLSALRSLQNWGCDHIYFKYCSTFDSTPQGNIGPVLDALRKELHTDRSVVVPSFPANNRTVYQGHLFVGSDLLENSSMRYHPLTPMTQSRVSQLLSAQTTTPVHEIHWQTVQEGSHSVTAALNNFGAGYTVVDAVSDEDIRTIGQSVQEEPLVSGASSLALGLGAQQPAPGSQLPRAQKERESHAEFIPTRRVVIAGSVSQMTLAQIANAMSSHPIRHVDVDHVRHSYSELIEDTVAWAANASKTSIPVITSATTQSDVVDHSIDHDASQDIEDALANISSHLVVDEGIDGMIVAGGETSGAVVKALNISLLKIGPMISPGVCWAFASSHGHSIAICLKSGNFGTVDMFTSAWKELS